MTKLSKFEGRSVDATAIRVVKAGDGLSTALQVAPQQFALGDTVYLVLEAEVSKVHHEEIKDTGSLRRVHTLSVETATIVEQHLVGEVIDEQKRLIEETLGVQRLPLEED